MAGQKKIRQSAPSGASTHARELNDAREQAVATEEILVALGRAGANSGEILDKIAERALRLCRADALESRYTPSSSR